MTDKDAAFLIVGTARQDEVTYPDIDLELKAGSDGVKTLRHANERANSSAGSEMRDMRRAGGPRRLHPALWRAASVSHFRLLGL